MTRSPLPEFNPKLDLVLERVVDVPVELVWRAWTMPEHLVKWFTPAPWSTVHCELDLRPGGIFHTVMRSPEGKDFPGTGCYLEIVPNQRLTWTNALQPGFRPTGPAASSELDCADLTFTAIVTMEAQGSRTKYTALAMHKDEAGRKAHDEMGFHDGWGKALDQLVALAKEM